MHGVHACSSCCYCTFSSGRAPQAAAGACRRGCLPVVLDVAFFPLHAKLQMASDTPACGGSFSRDSPASAAPCDGGGGVDFQDVPRDEGAHLHHRFVSWTRFPEVSFTTLCSGLASAEECVGGTAS